MSKSEVGVGDPIRLAQTVPEPKFIGGKLFAGVVVNARPHVEVWPRCICGFLDGRDHQGRGFDNKPIRTSTVERLLVDGYDIYAITQNSAYLLQTMNLMLFLRTPEWVDDIDNLITQAIAPKKESKVD
jgi:hypothetical protein